MYDNLSRWNDYYGRMMKFHKLQTYKGPINSRVLCLQVVRESDFAEVIEPGMYIVYAGGSQPGDGNAPSNVLASSFSIVGDATPLSKCS